MREVLIFGQLNDGFETPGSDIDRTLNTTQVCGFVEVETTLARPGWFTVQGDPGTTDFATGIAIKDGLMTYESHHWNWLATWRQAGGGAKVLTVRANFQGCKLSIMSTKRPAGLSPEQRRMFNEALSIAVHDERVIGRVPILLMDTNANPQDIADITWLHWYAPYETSVVGMFIPGSVQMLACTSLQRTGEHPPVIGMMKVPLP